MEARMNLLPSTNYANHGCTQILQGDRDNTGDNGTLFEHTESQFKQLFNTRSCFYARCPMSPEQKANTMRQCSDLLFARTNSNQSQVDDDDISVELERVTMNGINEYATGDISRLDVAFCGYLTKLVENFKKDSHWDPLFPPKEVNWVDLKASTGSSNVILLFHFFNEASKREEFVHYQARQNFISVISNRLQNDVRSWIGKQVKSAMTIGKEPVLQRTKLFVEKLNAADELLQPKQSVVSFFEPLGIDYYRIASTEIDIVVADKARHLIEDMDAYQTKYQKFKVNIRETTELSIRHFFAIRSIRSTILRKFSEKELFRVSLFMFEEWFSSAVTFWLGTFRYECFDALKNSIQMEKNVVKMISSAHTSSEYLISIFTKMTSEWQEIRLKDADMQLLGAMKITDMICDCVKEYLESVLIIERNKSGANKRYEVPERVAFISVCLINLSNLRSYVKELSSTLKWELVAKSISMKHENVLIGKTVLQSLRTMVASTEEEMGRFANDYAMRIREELSEEMKFLISSFATNPTEKTLNSLLEMFEKKLFSGLRKKLENLTKSECLVEMWQAQMAMLEESVEIGRPIGYYQEIQKVGGALILTSAKQQLFYRA